MNVYYPNLLRLPYSIFIFSDCYWHYLNISLHDTCEINNNKLFCMAMNAKINAYHQYCHSIHPTMSCHNISKNDVLFFSVKHNLTTNKRLFFYVIKWLGPTSKEWSWHTVATCRTLLNEKKKNAASWKAFERLINHSDLKYFYWNVIYPDTCSLPFGTSGILRARNCSIKWG